MKYPDTPKEAAAEGLKNAIHQPKDLLRWLDDRASELEAGKNPQVVMADVLYDLDIGRDYLEEVADKIRRNFDNGVYGGPKTPERETSTGLVE